MRRARIRQRRAIAAIAAILWLLGVEVLPNLHLAAHDHDHTHAADGSIVLHEQRHERGGGHDHGHHYDHHYDHRLGGHDHPPDVAGDELAALHVAHEPIALDESIWLGDHAAVERVPHTHDDGDAVAHDHDEVVDHDALAAAEHSDARDHRSARRHRDGQLAFDHDTPLGHAAAGIAHHAVALHQPPPPPLAPVSAPHAETWKHAEPIERRGSAARLRPSARGPPVA